MLTRSPTTRSIRRRNALVPLPLLPPVPCNTIVTSVRIVHNQTTSDTNTFDNNASPRSNLFDNNASSRSHVFDNSSSQISSPPSPTPTNLCFAPVTGCGAKRLRSARRRSSSCTPCQPAQPGSQWSLPATTALQKSNSVAVLIDTDLPMVSSAEKNNDTDLPLSSSAHGNNHTGPPKGSGGNRHIDTKGSNSTASNYDSSLLNPNRKPRSTIVVTVRLANPSPTNASYGSRSPKLVPTHRTAAVPATTTPHQSPDPMTGVCGAFAALQARKLAHRPRISSQLACSVVTAGDLEDPRGTSPLSSPSGTSFPSYVGDRTMYPRAPFLAGGRRFTRKPKSNNKGKNGGRVGMLRWAVLNNSGPEVGRRILAMGPKLAKEIWEAEREMEAVESNEMEVVENQLERSHVDDPGDCGVGQHGALAEQGLGDTEEHTAPDSGSSEEPGEIHTGEQHIAREKLAEECIRELEEMEVDSEDIEMEASSSATSPTTEEITTTAEKATETPKIEKNNNDRMDLDMPAPVATAAVTPLSTARQVQIQLEIAVEVFSPAKKAQKDAEKSKRWFERIAL